MNIFFTGGTGFIGKHMIDKLRNENKFQIFILSRQKRENQNGLSNIQGDISDTSLMSDYIERSDYVIHMAGSKNDPNSYFQTNMTGTENIIKACRRSKTLKKLIYLSSVGVIGKTNKVIVDEQTECHPVNEYEKTKFQAELIVKEYSKYKPGSTVILRPTNVFGENDPELHLLNLIRKVKNDRFYFVGNDIKRYYLNYLYVREISELIPSLLSFTPRSDLYILNTPVLLSQFIGMIKEILNNDKPIKHLPYWPVKFAALCFDLMPKALLNPPPINSLKLLELTNTRQYSPALLAREANWKPAFSMRDSLHRLIIHYREKGLLT